MQKQFICGVLFFLLLLLSGCDKKEERMDDFWIEFATVVKQNNKLCFELDNNKVLTPESLTNYTGNEGQRVILNFTPTSGDRIKVNSVSDILTGKVLLTDNREKILTDPVDIQSIWVSGKYLNIILDIEYFDKPHRIGLFRDITAKGNILYLSHSRGDDLPGYTKKLYASFRLSSLHEGKHETPFVVIVNTNEGVREFRFSIKK